MSTIYAKTKQLKKEKDIAGSYLNSLQYFTDFAKENNFKTIEIISFPPFDSNILREIQDNIKNTIKGFDTSYHLPIGEINICALNPDIRKAAINETKNMIDLAEKLNINKTPIHPGSYASMPDIYKLMEHETKKIAEQAITDIHTHSKRKNIELCIENMPFNEPFFHHPDELKPFTEKGINILIDTAHAITSNINPIEFINQFENKISEIHLVDGFKNKPDTHHPLGTGDLNYTAFLDRLKETRFKNPIILETKSEPDINHSVKLLEEKGYL